MTPTETTSDHAVKGEVAPSALAITRLVMEQFRNYDNLDLQLEPLPVLIAGQNGMGKTNLLEAASLLAPGKGLRSASITELQLANSAAKPWQVAAEVTDIDGSHWVATARNAEGENDTRRVKINGAWQRGHAGLADILGIIWLTPSMDGMLSGSASPRRKYYDKLVAGFVPSHSAETGRYDYLMRERNQLLSQPGKPDPSWLSAIEQKMAESAVAIADHRLQVMERLQSALQNLADAFPKAILSIEGEVEQSLLTGEKALAVEQKLRETLQNQRSDDARSGRTLSGTHRSDMRLNFPGKNQPMEACSTGEQKALMLSLTMAVAEARTVWDNRPPLVLLDEVVAHLDRHRRESLFTTLSTLGAQAWMTATDAETFAPLKDRAQLLQVDQASITRLW
ncbi:DNA replication/repair protein RecF [bacterium]|nr:DNA replication/repair protein RecF [bacterium]